MNDELSIADQQQAVIDSVFGAQSADESQFDNFDDSSDQFDDGEEESQNDQFSASDEDEYREEYEPPGYISYEDWIAQGKDPDLWQGKKKYEQQYDLMHELKDFKKKFSELENSSQEQARMMTEALAELKQQAYDEARKEMEQQLQEAIDNQDVDEVIRIKDEMNANKAPVSDQPQKLHPVYEDFFSKNAILDKNSNGFSQAIFDEFGRLHAGVLRNDGVQPGDPLSDIARERYANLAMDRLKNLFPEHFESPRNSRQGRQGNQRRAQQKPSPKTSLSNYKLKAPNRQNADAAQQMYEMMKNKYGQEAADSFASSLVGDQ